MAAETLTRSSEASDSPLMTTTPTGVASLTITATRLWWRNIFMFSLCNIVWFALQLLIVTGPTATAAIHTITRRVIDGELVAPKDYFVELRRHFLVSLRWGAVNLIVVGVLVANFFVYQDELGPYWTTLRLLWAAVGLTWLVVSLFYWPFAQLQATNSLRTALRNSAIFIMTRPGLALGTTLVCAGVLLASIAVTLPLIIATGTWVALLTTLAVDIATASSLTPDEKATS